MEKIINTKILFNPANWIAVFIVFTIWAFAAHFAAQHLNQQAA